MGSWAREVGGHSPAEISKQTVKTWNANTGPCLVDLKFDIQRFTRSDGIAEDGEMNAKDSDMAGVLFKVLRDITQDDRDRGRTQSLVHHLRSIEFNVAIGSFLVY